MRSVGITRLVLITPFRPELTEMIRDYLEYKDFDVVHVKGANIQKNSDLVKHTGQQLYNLVKNAIRETKKPFDGIHINCPRWPVFDMVEVVEDEFSVPVVSSCPSSGRDSTCWESRKSSWDPDICSMISASCNDARSPTTVRRRACQIRRSTGAAIMISAFLPPLRTPRHDIP